WPVREFALERNNRQGGSVHNSLCLFDALDRIVQSFLHKSERHPEDQPDNQAYGDIGKFLRSDGHLGRPSGVNQMNVGCAKTGRNRCILEPLKQAVIELLIRIKLTL